MLNVTQCSPRQYVAMMVGVLTVAVIVYGIVFTQLFPAEKGIHGSQSYVTLATHWNESGVYSMDGEHPTVERLPLYPLVIKWTMQLSPDRWQTVLFCVQGLFSILTGCILFAIALKLTGQRMPGVVLVVLYVLNILFNLENFAVRETVFFECFLYGLFWLLIQKELSLLKCALIGLLAGLLILSRPTGFVIVGLLPLLLFLRPEFVFNLSFFKQCGAMLLVFGLILSPWIWFVHSNFGKLSWVMSDNGGQDMYKGHNDFFLTYYPWVDVDKLDAHMDVLTEHLPKQDRRPYLEDLSYDCIRQEPGAFLQRTLVKFMAFFSPIPTPIGEGQLVNEGDTWRVEDYRIDFIAWITVPYNALLLFASLAAFIFWKNYTREQQRFLLQAVLILGAMAAIHSFVHAETRYRLPFDGLMMMAATLYFGQKLLPKSQAEV